VSTTPDLHAERRTYWRRAALRLLLIFVCTAVALPTAFAIVSQLPLWVPSFKARMTGISSSVGLGLYFGISALVAGSLEVLLIIFIALAVHLVTFGAVPWRAVAAVIAPELWMRRTTPDTARLDQASILVVRGPQRNVAYRLAGWFLLGVIRRESAPL
jgi:hypothetical protein